jgi:hypothetical protein
MSRWFRHYAGMARDDKLVRASIKSKQPVERVVWVWAAILESAAEIDDDGRYEIEHEEMARFLRCPASKIAAVEAALADLGRVDGLCVAKWASRQFQSDRSAARTKAYRERRRDTNVTSQERRGDSPETETETETETEKKEVGRDGENCGFGFDGETIRLKQADMDKWERLYSSIPDIRAELSSIDAWFQDKDDLKPKWFWRTQSMLAKRHQENITKRAANGYGAGHSGIPV